MNTLAIAFALIASIASPAPKSQDAGIIALDRVHTTAPARKAHLAPHRVSAPSVRFVDSVPGCTTRTLANDKSGQKVTYCN